MDSELKNILKQVSEGTMQDVEMNTNLIEAGLDSIKFIKLIVAVEEFFEIEVEDDCLSIDVLSTLEDIKKQIIKYKETA